MTNPPGVEAIIVAFHRLLPLQISVPALLDAGFGVIVVNVESDPEITAFLAGTSAIEVPTALNVGFGAAVNAGAVAATAPVVVYMNDDLAFSAEAVAALAKLVSSGICSVVVPAVTTPAGALEPTICALPTIGRLLLEWALTPDHQPRFLPRIGVEKWRRPLQRERIDAASAVVVACRRDLLVQVPFSTAYFLYWEESEWFWHLHQRGTDIWYDPSITVQHEGGRGDLRAAKAELLARNAVRCVRRTQGRRSAAIAWPVVVLWNLRLVGVAAWRAVRSPSVRTRDELRTRLAGLNAAGQSVTEIR